MGKESHSLCHLLNGKIEQQVVWCRDVNCRAQDLEVEPDPEVCHHHCHNLHCHQVLVWVQEHQSQMAEPEGQKAEPEENCPKAGPHYFHCNRVRHHYCLEGRKDQEIQMGREAGKAKNWWEEYWVVGLLGQE